MEKDSNVLEKEIVVAKKRTKRKPIFGIVKNASRLRLRKAASSKSEILIELERGEVVGVDLEESTENFYKVIIKDKGTKLEGFVMKEFIDLEN